MADSDLKYYDEITLNKTIVPIEFKQDVYRNMHDEIDHAPLFFQNSIFFGRIKISNPNSHFLNYYTKFLFPK